MLDAPATAITLNAAEIEFDAVRATVVGETAGGKVQPVVPGDRSIPLLDTIARGSSG